MVLYLVSYFAEIHCTTVVAPWNGMFSRLGVTHPHTPSYVSSQANDKICDSKGLLGEAENIIHNTFEQLTKHGGWRTPPLIRALFSVSIL